MFNSLLQKYGLILFVNVIVISAAFGIDFALAPLTPITQFFVQIPILVLLIDWIYRTVIAYKDRIGVSSLDIDAAFVFAAPLAAFASPTLFADLRKVALQYGIQFSDVV